MAIPLKANNTRRLRLRRRRPQELSPWSGSILETSTTWRATYRPKVSSICCRCAMPPPRPPSDLESFCCWQFREREQTRSSSLCCHSPRDTPPQSLRPKGSLSAHYSTPRLASLPLPPRNGRARSLLEPCLIAYSRHLPKSLLHRTTRAAL